MKDSKIEWTDHTFNGWRGCTKVSPGCAHCYAEALSKRTGHGEYKKGVPRERMSAAYWKQPLKWDRQRAEHVRAFNEVDPKNGGELHVPRRKVFSASLSDWLDDEVPIEWLADLLKLIHDTPNLDWLLLTKRPENFHERIFRSATNMAIRGFFEVNQWLAKWYDGAAPGNVWLGTTVENPDYLWRIAELKKIPAAVRFLSCEPLLADIQFLGLLKQVDWVIYGGESGPGARPMHPDWARSLRDQCNAAAVPFFFKQWGDWYPSMQAEAEAALVSGKGPLLRHDGRLFSDNEAVTFCCSNCRVDEVLRIGKKTAGRLLDGLEHSAFPQSSISNHQS